VPSALRLSAEPLQVFLVLEPLQPIVERRCTGLAKGLAGQAQEFIVQLSRFEHPILGAAPEAAPVSEPDRDRARHPGVLRARLRHQPDAPAKDPNLRVAQCRLVEGFGVACFAAQRQRYAKRNAVLRQHQIGWLQDVVALDHALRTGDGDRLDIRAAKAVRSLQIAHRSDRGMRGGVARVAFQHRRRDDKLLAEAAGQLGLVPFRAEHLQKPELAFEHGARPLEPVGRQARGKDTRLGGPAQVQALDHAPIAMGEFEQPTGERPGDAQRIGYRRGTQPQQIPGTDPTRSCRAEAAAGFERWQNSRKLHASILGLANHHLHARSDSVTVTEIDPILIPSMQHYGLYNIRATLD
jgi:hypothetical protein